jgi:hypothetical protein
MKRHDDERRTDELLKGALDDMSWELGEPCPDPEELAAFYERSLSPESMLSSEAHISSCEACQQRLAALSRSEPELGPPAGEASRWAWWQRHLAWAAPAMAIVIAVSIWFALRPAPPEVASVQLASRAEEEALPSPPEAITIEEAEVVLPAEKPSEKGRGEMLTAPAAEQRATADAPAAKVASPEAVAAPPPAAQDTRVATMRARETAVADVAEMVLGESVAHLVVTAPGGRVMWRLDPGGGIARSDDGGVTWPSHTAVGLELHAAAAVSESVCWVVGKGGAVLRTTDGERWARVGRPTGEDLVAVEARDESNATVTAASGARYETRDGGRSWQTGSGVGS